MDSYGSSQNQSDSTVSVIQVGPSRQVRTDLTSDVVVAIRTISCAAVLPVTVPCPRGVIVRNVRDDIIFAPTISAPSLCSPIA